MLAYCPKCADVADHIVLKASPNSLTVRCHDCGDVRSMAPQKARDIELKLVISDGPKAQADRLVVDRADEISIDDEFEFNGHRMIVTGIEIDGGNTTKCLAEVIHVLHAKMFNTVKLRLSVNEGEKTRSARLDVEPNAPYQIGQVVAVGFEKWVVKTIKSDMNRTLHRGALPARSIVRLFCDVAPPWVKEGKIIGTRRRGAPPERRGDAPKSRVKGPRSGYGTRR
jgi:uncharacterized Zn finger protein